MDDATAFLHLYCGGPSEFGQRLVLQYQVDQFLPILGRFHCISVGLQSLHYVRYGLQRIQSRCIAHVGLDTIAWEIVQEYQDLLL